MNYLSFKEFVNKYGIKNEATSNVEIKEILKLMNTSCGIYMRDDKFNTTSGIANSGFRGRCHTSDINRRNVVPRFRPPKNQAVHFVFEFRKT